MYIAKTVAKPAGISPGSASPKKANVTIFDMDDVAFFPDRDENGIVIAGNILMKPGKKMIQVYFTRSKISAPYESDGDEDSISIKPSFEAQHPGNKREGREFIQNWLGRNVGIIHETCDGQKELVGTPCAPLQMKPSKQDNNDGLFHMLKFEAFASSNLLPALYEGALALTSSGATVALITAVPVSATGGTVLSLPAATANTKALFAKNDTLPHGTVISLLGNGGTGSFANTVEDGISGNVTVILKAGTVWTALVNSFLNLKVFRSGATTYLIEESRG